MTQKAKARLRRPVHILAFFAIIWGSSNAQAGTFSLPHFVNPSSFAIGVEPEITLTEDAGIAGNLQFTYGLTDLMNVTGILGTGTGSRQFRVGGNATFDIFPDIEGQPGIGIGVRGLYYRLNNKATPDMTQGQFELTGVPYLHKTFATAGGELEPFLTLPIGMAFSQGKYKALSSVTVGSFFKSSENVRFIVEFGMPINNTDAYLSGGIVYYH